MQLTTPGPLGAVDESPIAPAGVRTEAPIMDPALVSCRGCSRTWHSRTMADGLRAIGRCPRCSGELAWADAPAVDPAGGVAPAAAVVAVPVAAARGDVAPHLVLGVPRRDLF